MYPDTQLYIDGAWCASASGRTHPVVNPATGEVIGKFAWADRADLDRALAAVDKGFQTWKKVSAYERSKIMRKAADLLRERLQSIAEIMTMEQGKTVAEAKAEILNGADTIDWFAEEGRRAYGRIIPARAEERASRWWSRSRWVRSPLSRPGTSRSTRWYASSPAALTTGCSIIVKAPEETPGIARPIDPAPSLMPACHPVRDPTWSTACPAEISSNT